MMNDLILYLYLIDVFDNLGRALGSALVALVAVLSAICIFVVVFWTDDIFDEVKPSLVKYSKIIVLVFCVLGVLKIATPTTKTMYIALGLHTANQVMQAEPMAQVGNQAMRILQAKLDEYEKELTKENANDTDNSTK